MKYNYYAVLFIIVLVVAGLLWRFGSVPLPNGGSNPSPPPSPSSYTGTLTGTWQKKGIVLSDGQGINEPSVLYEGNPQILTGHSEVFKMWYRLGWSQASIGYAESSDGLSWTKYSGNPVLTSGNPYCPYVFKYGSTYYLYVTDDFGSLNLYTSNNGLSWGGYSGNPVLTLGSGWDGRAIGNVCVWVEGGTWHMVYEAMGSQWNLGLATSSDGKAWTKYSGNPVLIDGGGPDVIKQGSMYYMWFHAGQLPTQIYLATSTNLVTWSSRSLVVPITQPWEASQTADPEVCIAGNTVWMFYTGVEAQTPGAQSIGAAVLS